MMRRRAGGGLLQGAAAGPQAAAVAEHRYQMRERLFDIGDDFWIEGPGGRRAFKVDGKALRLRSTLNLEDPSGRVVCQIQERVARVRDSMAIERDGRKIAEVHKDLVNVVRDHFKVDLQGVGPELDVTGNLVAHEYHIQQAGRQVAEVSRRWFRVRDTYGVEIAPGQDDALILAITICIEQLTHAGEG